MWKSRDEYLWTRIECAGVEARKRAGLQAHAPDLCVPVVEGTDQLRVVIEVCQRGVNGVEECGRIGNELSRRGDAQGVDHKEKDEWPDKPGKDPRIGTTRRRGVALQLVAHNKEIGAWVATVKGGNG